MFSRFKKPRSYAVNGSPDSSIISEQTTSPSQRPPVLRNFSYPTHVGSGGSVPSSSPRAGQTTWDQLGEICNFSPDTVGKAQGTGCDEPFFFKRDPVPYVTLSGEESEFTASARFTRVADHKSSTKDEVRPRKRQRRSGLPSLSFSRFQGKQAGTPDSDPHKQQEKLGRASKILSIGGHIFPRRNSAMERLQETSCGPNRELHHSRDSQTPPPRETPGRPVLNSGSLVSEPMHDHVDVDCDIESHNTFRRRTNTQNSFQHDIEQSVFTGSRSSYQFPRINAFHRRAGSQGGATSKTALSSDPGKVNGTFQRINDSGRKGKGAWLSQLRNWVATSEPSTQASKQHRIDAFGKTDMAIHSSKANAKTHLPIVMLSPEPVKSKRADPEPVRIIEAERGNGRRSCTGSVQMSQGSLSSTSRHTSFSSASSSSATYDTGYWT